MSATAQAVIAVACIVFAVAQVVAVVAGTIVERRRTPPVAHVESGTSHMRDHARRQ